MPLPEKPLTRIEQYLSNIAGEDRAIPAKPFTRIEQYLDYIAKNGGGGGGGGGSVTIDPVPTQGSQNAVSSGGVYDRLTELSASDISANGTGSKTVTGKPIVIEDADEGYAEFLVLDLEPVQDLHGYTKPWAGGAGKNLLPLILSNIKAINTEGTWNGNAYTRNGITFTINTDSSGNITGITANGTANGSGNNTFWIISYNNLISFDKDVILNGVPSGSTSSTYYIGGSNIGTMTSSVTKTAGSEFSVALVIVSGVTVSNIVFKPMIRLATEADATFEPYSNICPIYPANSRNLLPLTLERLTALNSTRTWNNNVCSISGVTYTLETNNDGSINSIIVNGTNETSTQIGFIIGEMLLLKNTTYVLSGSLLNGGYSSFWINIFNVTDRVNVVDIKGSDTYKSFSLTNDVTVRFIIYVAGNATVSNLVFKPMLSLASIADHVFIPYQAVGVKRDGDQPDQSTSLTLPLGQDVYGGRYDVGSGELIIDREYISITPDMIDAINTTNFGGVVVGFTSSGSYTNRSVLLCDSMTAIEFTVANFSKTDCIGVRQDDGRLVLTPNWVQSATTLEQFKSLLPDNPVNIIASLATPITVSLTPQQLSLLQAYNLITSDDDGVTSIDLTYIGTQTSNVQERLDESSELGQNIISSIAPAETGIASTNYSVGDYLMLNGVFCKVTSAIATGETITVGTNVTATTVAAELLSIISQLS